MTPATHPGLLGICLSGAGPTILALVDKNSQDSNQIGVHARIGEAIKSIWKADGGIEVEWLALEVDDEGATCVEVGKDI